MICTLRAGSLRDPGDTLAVRSSSATLLVRADVPAETVERVASTILTDYDALRSKVPVLPPADLERTDGLTAPLHEGAEAAFAAAGG
jgi:TRAP-type uncharacterized transport system substrate-binding protein